MQPITFNYDRLEAIDHHAVLDKLILEYFVAANRLSQVCPPKKTMILERHSNNAPKSSYSTMMAVLSDGTIGSKQVYYSEDPEGLNRRAVMTLTEVGSSNPIQVFDATVLSEYRSAILTAFAAKLLSYGMTPELAVTIAGAGKIATWIMKVFHWLFEIDEFYFITKNGELPEDGEIRRFAKKNDIAVSSYPTTGENLPISPIMISATTANTKEEGKSYFDLEGAELYISLDGGYFFATEFASNCVLYSDHPEQMDEHLDDEFPWDNHHDFRGRFRHIMESHPFPMNKPIAAFLYGIGLADVAVAKVLARELKC